MSISYLLSFKNNYLIALPNRNKFLRPVKKIGKGGYLLVDERRNFFALKILSDREIKIIELAENPQDCRIYNFTIEQFRKAIHSSL
jgi:hypothetical protein